MDGIAVNESGTAEFLRLFRENRGVFFAREIAKEIFLFEGSYEKYEQIRKTIFRTAGGVDGLGEKILR